MAEITLRATGIIKRTNYALTFVWIPPTRFELVSPDPKSCMIDRYTTGVLISGPIHFRIPHPTRESIHPIIASDSIWGLLQNFCR